MRPPLSGVLLPGGGGLVLLVPARAPRLAQEVGELVDGGLISFR